MAKRSGGKKRKEDVLTAVVVVALVAFGSYLLLQGDAAQDLALHTHPDAADVMEKHAHDEGTPAHSHGDLMDVSGESTPKLDLRVFKDPKAGYNFQLVTENFEFSPENASLEHVPGEGHAHIYVDGVKINRVYSEWYHIASLEPGIHEVRATLNSNNHMYLAVDGVPVQDTETLKVSE